LQVHFNAGFGMKMAKLKKSYAVRVGVTVE